MLVPSPLEDILRAKRRQLLALRGRIKRGGEFDTLNHYEAVAREIQAEVEESPDCGGGGDSKSLLLALLDLVWTLLFSFVCVFCSIRRNVSFLPEAFGAPQASKKPPQDA